MFDWRAFCEDQRLPFVEHGKNVARGHININCPFCGDDKTHHMGLQVDGTGNRWGCWRDPQHRGNRPHRLIMKLLHVGFEVADGIAKNALGPAPAMEELQTKLEALGTTTKQEELPACRPPMEFKGVTSSPRARKLFGTYLRERGYPASTWRRLHKFYGVRSCLTGPWKQRLILPIYNGRRCVGWTGRLVVSSRTQPKYKTHPEGNMIKRCLYNHQRALKGGSTLVVVEGPFDALRVDFYGRKHGIRSVATMGTSATSHQRHHLLELATAYDRVVINYDRKAESQALYLQSQLRVIDPEVLFLPDHIDDPGEVPPGKVPLYYRG